MSSISALRIRLFCSDLDGTLLGNPESTRRFKAAWHTLSTPDRPILIYSSGRLVEDMRRFTKDGTLPEAEYYIGGVGTQIYDIRACKYVTEFEGRLRDGWEAQRVLEVVDRFPGTRRQPDEFQHPFKCSWFLNAASPAAIRELEDRLSAVGLSVHVVYSSGRDLDVLPKNATKGGALSWLCERLGIPINSVLVAGDTGNDSSMFRLPGVNGIVVENAQPELYEATVDIPVYS